MSKPSSFLFRYYVYFCNSRKQQWILWEIDILRRINYDYGVSISIINVIVWIRIWNILDCKRGDLTKSLLFLFAYFTYSFMKGDDYMKHETLKNKIFAMIIVLIGLIVLAASKDATILLLSVLFGVPLFVAKRNYID